MPQVALLVVLECQAAKVVHERRGLSLKSGVREGAAISSKCVQSVSGPLPGPSRARAVAVSSFRPPTTRGSARKRGPQQVHQGRRRWLQDRGPLRWLAHARFRTSPGPGAGAQRSGRHRCEPRLSHGSLVVGIPVLRQVAVARSYVSAESMPATFNRPRRT